MVFFVLTRFVLVKYSRVFVERPSQGTSSLALRLTTVNLDVLLLLACIHYLRGTWFLDGRASMLIKFLVYYSLLGLDYCTA